MNVRPDLKRAPRVKDPALLRRLHLRWRSCALCGQGAGRRLSLHHIYPKGQGGDDVVGNLIMLCGHGTAGCHGDVEARSAVTLTLLRIHIDGRSDVIEYLDGKLGGIDRALAWLDRYVAA